MMTRRHITLVLTALGAILTLTTGTSAAAACYADYKAKREDPLRLHYGVIQVADAACQSGNGGQAAASDVAARIASDGWLLLNIVSTFDESGLEEREESAGEFYLRY